MKDKIMQAFDFEKMRHELAEFQAAVKTPDGQKIMEHLRKISGADKSSFRPGDAMATFFCCGLRDAYLLMQQDAERDLALLTPKQKEQENGIQG